METLVKRVLVLGGGSAGFMAAAALKKKLPALQVQVIRSKSIGIIGVGEGSVPPFTRFIHEVLGVPLDQFVKATLPGWKLGTCFLWGPRRRFFFPLGPHMEMRAGSLPKAVGFYCQDEMETSTIPSAMMSRGKLFVCEANGLPSLHPHFAYHVENDRFAAFLEQLCVAAGVEVCDDTVQTAEQDEAGITALRMTSGATIKADLFVDCSGFASLLLGKTLAEPFVSYADTLFCDRAVVGGWDRRPDEKMVPYTVSETMDSGWCWQIDHPDRVHRGYVYSSAFIDDDSAERELRLKNPRIGATRVVRFVSGRYERSWVKNVVAIGNASGFVEPLEATSLGVIATRCELLADLLVDSHCRVSPIQAEFFSRHTAVMWDALRRFLSIHYRHNTRLDTPFWRHCREHVQLVDAQPIVDYYCHTGPSLFVLPGVVGPNDLFGARGYACILVGLKVPWAGSTDLTAAEKQAWQQHCEQNARIAESTGMTPEQVLEFFTRG